jgi:hypothetical protein
MPLPQSVKIGAIILPVVLVDEIPVDGGQASGHWDFATGELRVSRALNPTEGQQLETMLHEVLHVIDDALALGLREKQLHRLSTMLFVVLVDNPGLVGGTR